MIRLDMSEYQERHTVSGWLSASRLRRLDEGTLTGQLGAKPYSVILPTRSRRLILTSSTSCFRCLRTAIDRGAGRTVDFRNSM